MFKSVRIFGLKSNNSSFFPFIGWIDQGNVGIIPSFLNMRMVIAVGMVGATEEEWTDYQSMFARSVRHINYSMVQGYDGECLLPMFREQNLVFTLYLYCSVANFS